MFMPGGSEILVILLVALLIFGPRKMPEIGRSIGQALRELRRTSQDLMGQIERLGEEMDEKDPYR
jgi:sec-independent protein translocase protein TatA